ncbi:MAG: YebC/PmpR family DNA-binding transcriptional regulator [Gammaproteobacteria bacterium]|nr:YebC/PmpR family DNA-binding transcriptional regulator [Gammaproteobacteria bacterium]
MAGHSKWANIKHRKGKQDAKRGKLYSRLIREVTIAARMGGADTSGNSRLRAAIDNALSNNMPKDTIERAVARGAGESDGANVEEVRYEGYGPGGIAVMVDCMTDNRNRTVADVRHAFTKYGGNLGTDGSVGYLFRKRGVLNFPAGTDEDALLAAALEAGAEDVVADTEGAFEVLTDADDMVTVKEALIAAGHAPESAEVTMHAATTTSLDLDTATRLMKMLDLLDDLDDVQKVYSNASISADILEQL